MKNIFKTLLISMLFFSAAKIENKASAQQANVNLSVFQNSLSPYGRWMNHGTYGQVWVSNTPGFVPYQTGGHWAYTDYGWTWVSNYDWGWAPFHYGRWAYEPGIGWYWVPGYDWAPAWVAWRNNDDYYGWAPLSPGLNISVGIGYGNQIPYNYWVFAPHRYINDPYISRYYLPRNQNVTIIKNTTVINNVNNRNNITYVSGPRREDVEKINHTQIRTYTVANSAKPGRTVINNNTVNVYRPVVNKTQVAVGAATTNYKTIINNNKIRINNNSSNKLINKTNNTRIINNNQPVKQVRPANNISVEKNNNPVPNAPAKIKPVNRNVNAENNPVITKHSDKPAVNNNVPIQKPQINNPPVQRNNMPQKQFNNHPMQMKPMNNSMPKMQKPSSPPHMNQGGGHPHKPGR